MGNISIQEILLCTNKLQFLTFLSIGNLSLKKKEKLLTKIKITVKCVVAQHLLKRCDLNIENKTTLGE